METDPKDLPAEEPTAGEESEHAQTYNVTDPKDLPDALFAPEAPEPAKEGEEFVLPEPGPAEPPLEVPQHDDAEACPNGHRGHLARTLDHTDEQKESVTDGGGSTFDQVVSRTATYNYHCADCGEHYQVTVTE